MEKDNRKNLIVRVKPEFYRQIKVYLAMNGKTLQDYMTDLIEKDLKKHKTDGRIDETKD